MAIVASWSGDNAPLGAVSSSSVGDGDSPFTHITGSLTVVNDGARPTAISLPDASSVSRVGWWRFPGYPLGDCAARVYLTMAGYASSGGSIIRGIASGTSQWSVRGQDDGTLVLRDDASATEVWYGSIPVGLDRPVRIEVTRTAAGLATLTAYAGDTMSVIDSGTGTVGSAALDEVWFGMADSRPTDGWLIDDLALSDSADPIGPAAEPPSPYLWWDGSDYAQVEMYTWDGSYAPVTPPL